eukprot:2843926-Karenia_brevis.AAC.1
MLTTANDMWQTIEDLSHLQFMKAHVVHLVLVLLTILAPKHKKLCDIATRFAYSLLEQLAGVINSM